MNVSDIREQFAAKYLNKEFIKDKTGATTVELIGQSFEADENTIFGEVNENYVKREIEWYVSQSLNVNDIPGETPKIWKQVADPDGFINSNYGWCVFHKNNYEQYENCLKELLKNKDSRRAVMIYTRPSMWLDYNKNGMSDFCCTENVQYFIRNEELISTPRLRSNDAIFGYKNDFAWQIYILNNLYDKLSLNYTLKSKKIIWNSGSLHIYSSHYYLIEHYIKTGETHITKEKYKELYGV